MAMIWPGKDIRATSFVRGLTSTHRHRKFSVVIASLQILEQPVEAALIEPDELVP